MLKKIRQMFSSEHRAERDERRRANREASAEYRNHLASDAATGAIREGIRREGGRL